MHSNCVQKLPCWTATLGTQIWQNKEQQKPQNKNTNKNNNNNKKTVLEESEVLKTGENAIAAEYTLIMYFISVGGSGWIPGKISQKNGEALAQAAQGAGGVAMWH